MSNQFAKVFEFENGSQLLLTKRRSGTDLSEPYVITASIQVEYAAVQFEPELERSFRTEITRDMEFLRIEQEEARELFQTLEKMANDFLRQKGYEMN